MTEIPTLGHTDAKLTLSVYQQVLDMSGDTVDTLEQVLGGDLDEIGARVIDWQIQRGRPAQIKSQRFIAR